MSEIGTVRIGKDLVTYEFTGRVWKKTKKEVKAAFEAIKLFKAHGKFKDLVDKKNPRFLKGEVTRQGLLRGARINVMPDGQVLDKAYSLFAPHLTIHDQNSDDHWDVLYQNYGGTYAYLYTLEKKKKAQNRKYRKVAAFSKIHDKLLRKVSLALHDDKDMMALPMYTLLKTYMRIGNEIYFKAHKHKGLTTLKKADVAIKGREVTFNYIGKDGVPNTIKKRFSAAYVDRLAKKIAKLKGADFVFANSKGHPLPELQFKKAFLRYCGQEFYPHVVRSYHATSRVKDFLINQKNPSKQEIRKFLFSVAADLGHKHYVKKTNEWKENYSVTLNSYVQPSYGRKIRELCK
jgi:hypothetical protein